MNKSQKIVLGIILIPIVFLLTGVGSAIMNPDSLNSKLLQPFEGELEDLLPPKGSIDPVWKIKEPTFSNPAHYPEVDLSINQQFENKNNPNDTLSVNIIIFPDIDLARSYYSKDFEQRLEPYGNVRYWEPNVPGATCYGTLFKDDFTRDGFFYEDRVVAQCTKGNVFAWTHIVSADSGLKQDSVSVLRAVFSNYET